MRVNLLDYTKDELSAFLADWGEAPYRAAQLFGWLHKKRAGSLDEMTDLPAALRQRLAAFGHIGRLEIRRRLESATDGTVKYLYGLCDGAAVESVVMRYRHGNSVCISTQVGCRMGCAFCASTIGGLARDLTAGEMLAEIYEAARALPDGEKIGSVVLMGIGEPLDNFENVCRFLQLLSHPAGFGLSLRHLSLSTCGLADGIRKLAERGYPLTLSVSLHAPDDALRSSLMPVNRRYPVADLLEACRAYFAATGRRVSFEYALIKDINDTPAHARSLAKLMKGMACHVNLILHNPVPERDFQRSTPQAVRGFQQLLNREGVAATVRRELGADLAAACGQLRQSTMYAQEATYDKQRDREAFL